MAVDWWADNGFRGEFYDFKAEAVEHERQQQAASRDGWIYIGVDDGRMRAKIGKTGGRLGTRSSSPQNPRYDLLCAFKVREGVDASVIHTIEDHILRRLETVYERIPHRGSGKLSEWFVADPLVLKAWVNRILYEEFSLYMLCHYCHDRNEGFIDSWENTVIMDEFMNRPSQTAGVTLRKGRRYLPSDISSATTCSDCLTPSGCGYNCTCWA